MTVVLGDGEPTKRRRGVKTRTQQAMGNKRGLPDPQQRSPFPYFHTLVKSDGAPGIQLGGPALLLFLQNEPLGSPSLP